MLYDGKKIFAVLRKIQQAIKQIAYFDVESIEFAESFEYVMSVVER